MNKDETVKAVTFDAGGTLIHLTERVGTTYSRIAESFGIAAGAECLETAFREVWKATPRPFSPPHGLSEEAWWKSVVTAVFESAAGPDFTDPDNFDVFFRTLFDYFGKPGVWALDADALDLLEHLSSRGIRTGIISNFDSRLYSILEDLEVSRFFDPVVISDRVRASKPDRKIFDCAISILDLPAAQILHVGDDPVCDVRGAEAAGMRTFLVGRRAGTLNQIIDKLPLAQT